MLKGAKKVLIVDDDDFLLGMYAGRFREAGFDVEIAGDGEEGLQKMRDGLRPDILSLDAIMPKKNGFEVLAAIRREQLMKNGLIIMVSNAAEKHDIQKGMRMGVAGYFVKANHTPSQIVNRAEQLLEKK